MKTMIKMLTLAAVLCWSISATAASGDLVVMQITGNSTFKLILNDISQAVQIQIKDRSGYLLHEESIAASGDFAKQFDLDNLPDGSYYLEVGLVTKVQVYNLTIRQGRIYTQNSGGREYFKPVVRQDDEVWTVSHFSPEEAALKVVIYDADNRAVVKDKLQGSMSLGRRYNVSGLPSGAYRIHLASEGRRYYHTYWLQQP